MRTKLLLLLLLLLATAEPTAAAAKSKKKRKKKQHQTDAGPANQLNTHTPLSLQIGIGSAGQQSELKLRLPPERGLTISSPQQLIKHVGHAWDTVVAPHQAGLADAKAGHLTAAPLTDGEAWHHYQAGQAGVIDSARFLVAFSVVPSLQQGGGGPLHAAAARGLVETVRELLEADDGREGEGVHARAADGTTPLHAAAATGHAEVVALLLEAGADPQAVGKSGATALHAAAAMGHGAAVAALLAGGTTTLVDEAHAFAGCTALHFAAEMGHVDVVEKLCEAGADADARKSTGGTPLHTAADCDQPRVVAALLAPPCAASPTKLLNGDTTPLYLAAQRGFSETAAALVDGGADVNFAMPNAVQSRQVAVPGALEMGAGGWYGAKNTERGNGATALHAAVENGHRECSRLLVAKGARQTGSMEGATPLIIALQYGHPAIALDLAAATPTPDLDAAVPVDGASALFVAAGSGYDEVVAALLRLGARPDTANKHGATPLSHAAYRGRLGAMRLLLEGGADANAGAPLLAALDSGRGGGGLRGAALAAAVKALVGAGARADGAALGLAAEAGEAEAAAALLDAPGGGGGGGGGGTAPLMKAAAKGHAELVSVLVSRGADANARGGEKMYGAGALYVAAQGGHLAACRALLEAGADADARLDQIGITPLFVAAERGAAAVVRLLLERGAATDVANWNGVTPLHMAAMRGHVGVVAALHGAGASLETRGDDGATPLLSVAAAAEPLEAAPRRAMLRWLLQRGASGAARDAAGRGALHAAASAGLVEAVEELTGAAGRGGGAAGASLAGATDAEGRAPLTLAVSGGHLATARALVRGGAPCGEAALEAAQQTRDSQMLKLISSACDG